MSELNYLRIAQILGGTITKIQPSTFGGFGAPQASAERFRLLRLPADESDSLPLELSKPIVSAFEKVRSGYELDRVLIDPALSKALMAEVRRAGINAPAVMVNKRLQAIRKSWKVYGVKLKPTTQAGGLEPEPYFYAAELGYVQLNYRREVSVDEIIVDSKSGQEFVSICKELKPSGDSMHFKWALLRLRKMRTLQRMQKTEGMHAEEIEERMKTVATLDRLSISSIPTDPGLFSFSEAGKPIYLYVGSGKSLRSAIEPFEGAIPFKAAAGQFWQPDLRDIALKFGVVKRIPKQPSARDLSLRLIEEKHPLFNMPAAA